MSEYYFSKLGTIKYNNTLCCDITKRVSLNEKLKNSPTLFYPYELKNGIREDTLANAYYQDPYYYWLIYLTNSVIDPYYDWNLDDNDFNNFIIEKYGSIEYAMKRTKYYQLNWGLDTLDITPSFYENQIPSVLKKYYTPNFGYSSRIISYTRRRADWITNTNKTIKFDFELIGNTQFVNNEIITITSNVDESAGKCEVISSNTSSMIIQNFELVAEKSDILTDIANSSIYFSGDISKANCHILGYTTLSENISDEEFVYWEPVSYYDYEKIKNESKKHIHLIDANYALPIAEELRLKLKD